MVGRFSVPLRHGSHDRGVTLEPCVIDGQGTDAPLMAVAHEFSGVTVHEQRVPGAVKEEGLRPA